MFFQFLHRLMIYIGLFLLLMAIIGVLFVNFSPEFGGTHSKEDKARYTDSGHYADGAFVNETPTSLDMPLGKILKLLPKWFSPAPETRPATPPPLIHQDSLSFIGEEGKSCLIWFGHSAFLLHMDGKNILIDPMFGDVPAPHPWLGKSRFNKELPISIEELPRIDAMIISHDHYDHLDYGSIQKLKSKTGEYYVPLGVAAHLKAWGIPEERIHELNWWDETTYDDIDLAFTPARHFSGRGVTNRSSTLWGSWVITGRSDKVFFSGDSGYGPHFKEIGEKYGPFDFAMMECGQYDENWSEIHMMPEETAQAAADVGAKVFMPIHWGAFTLAMHDWNDPPRRATTKAEELGIPMITPVIGRSIGIGSGIEEYGQWWRE